MAVSGSFQGEMKPLRLTSGSWLSHPHWAGLQPYRVESGQQFLRGSEPQGFYQLGHARASSAQK